MTVALGEMFSTVIAAEPSSRQEFDRMHRQPTNGHWQTASIVLTGILIAVAIALSCGICGVVAVLYRRQHCDRRMSNGRVYGLNRGDDGSDADAGDTKTTVGRPLTIRPAVGEQQQQRRLQLSTRSSSRPMGRATDDAANNNRAEVPLLQRQSKKHPTGRPEPCPQGTRCNGVTDTNNAAVLITNSAVTDRDSNTGPDIVMSTAMQLANAGTYQYEIDPNSFEKFPKLESRLVIHSR